jgi:hypothetical protein
MLYACDVRFDVTKNFEKIWFLGELNNGVMDCILVVTTSLLYTRPHGEVTVTLELPSAVLHASCLAFLLPDQGRLYPQHARQSAAERERERERERAACRDADVRSCMHAACPTVRTGGARRR